MYNFKKDAKVYIEFEEVLYPIDVYQDLSFSQTYNENSYKKKTLHSPLNLNEGATIVEANPANFSFTTPIREDLLNPNLPILNTSYISGNINSVNIYIEFSNKKYKLEKCVIENTVYNISMDSVFTVSISGTAAKLLEVSTLPALTVSVANTDPYVIIRGLTASIDNRLLSSLASLNIEINNDIEWIANSTINTTISSGINFRDNYVLTGRRISGSITEFIINEVYGQEFNTKGSVLIRLYSEVNQNPPFLTFSLSEAVYTRRINIDELLTRVYDFRLLSNNLEIIPTIRS
jgi:hypothetical protein